MPPRPFPFQLNIGTDICYTKRVLQLITRDGKTLPNLFRFMRQFLTAREQEMFVSHYESTQALVTSIEGKNTRAIDYLAGRWAAKEATIKAHRHRRLTFRDVQVLSRPDGRPYALVLDQPASKSWKPRHNDGHALEDSNLEDLSEDDSKLTPFHLQNDDLPGQIAKISISHDGGYATAVCLAAEEPSAGDVGGEAAAREP